MKKIEYEAIKEQINANGIPKTLAKFEYPIIISGIALLRVTGEYEPANGYALIHAPMMLYGGIIRTNGGGLSSGVFMYNGVAF